MGQLLPNRHPNKDFFVLDVADANPRDDMVSMEHPVYSLSVKPDHRELTYTAANGDRLVVQPSGKGLATIMDKDIVLYCISKLIGEAELAEKEGRAWDGSPTVVLTAHEVMVACNWRTNDAGYKRFEDALMRLAGTILKTDIVTGEQEETKGFGLIREFKIVKRRPDGRESAFGRMSRVEITLSDWTFRAIAAKQVLAIDQGYFRLRRPLERRMYEVARKQMGNEKSTWRIGLEKLQKRMGTNAPLKKFRFNVREIIQDGNLPEFAVSLTDRDIVEFTRKNAVALPDAPIIPVRADTMDKAQAIAARIGMSASDLYRDWCEYCHKSGEALRSPDAAFIAFCKQKDGSRPARQMTSALGQAEQIGLALGDVMKRSRG